MTDGKISESTANKTSKSTIKITPRSTPSVKVNVFNMEFHVALLKMSPLLSVKAVFSKRFFVLGYH